MVTIYTPYAEYQASTDRMIPLLVLKSVEALPVLTEAGRSE